MTLSGLIGSLVSAEQDLTLVPPSNSSVFASTSGTQGSLRWTLPPSADLSKCCDAVIVLRQPLSAAVLYTISFVLTNPSAPQSAPILSISSTLVTLIQNSLVTLAPDKAAPLFVPGFYFKNVGQSSAFVGFANQISVTFAATCVLESSTVVSVQLNSVFMPSNPTLQLSDKGNFLQAFGSSGNWDSAAMILSITVQSSLAPYVLYAFSFSITNKLTPQTAPSISIQASGQAVTILPVAMVQAASYDAAFYTVAESAEVSKTCQSGSWNRATASADWGGRRGAGFIGRGGLLLIDSSSPPFSLEAIWIQPTASLTYISSAVFVAGVQYTARVRLKNPPYAQSSPQAYIESSSFGIFKQTLNTNSTGVLDFIGSRAGDAAILKTYNPNAWHTVRIGQSTPFPLAQNTLTLTLVAATTLLDPGEEGAFVTLLGLAGSLTSDDLTFPFTFAGSAATVFATTGQWYQSGALLMPFLPGASMAPGSTAIVSFVLQNGVGIPSPQGPQTVTVLFAGNVRLPDTVAEADTTTILPFIGAIAGDARPLLVYPFRFILATAAQSTALQGASNIITVSLAANFPYATTARLTISSIAGPITGFYNAASWTGMTASFDSAAGTVTISITQPWTAGTSMIVQFTVTNPAAARSSSAMSVSLSDAQNSLSIQAQIQGAGGDLAPFNTYATGFMFRFISQSTPYPAAANLLSAAVQFTADLTFPASGAQLIFQGLTGPPHTSLYCSAACSLIALVPQDAPPPTIPLCQSPRRLPSPRRPAGRGRREFSPSASSAPRR
jgi:hypothetical protein